MGAGRRIAARELRAHSPRVWTRRRQAPSAGARAVAMALLLAAAVLTAGLARSAKTSSTKQRAERRSAREVTAVLIVLDGVRWQEVFFGEDAALLAPSRRARPRWELTPNLHELAREGELLGGSSAPMRASGPEFVSLPGYTEIFSAGAARCLDNSCPPASAPTFVDAVAARARLGEVAVIASWPEIGGAAARDRDRIVISAGRGGGHHRSMLSKDPASARLLAAGDLADPWPGHGEYRPDRYTAPLAVRYLKTHDVRFLFVGLGDTDEHAHRGDYARYLDALADADRVIGALGRELAGVEQRGGEALLIVTTDHGRSSNFRDHGRAHPESARVWALVSGRAARRAFATRRLRVLADIAPAVCAAHDIEPPWGLRPLGYPR